MNIVLWLSTSFILVPPSQSANGQLMFDLTICANGWRCLRSAMPGSLLRVGLTEGSPLSLCCKVMRWNDSWRAHCGTCSLFNDTNASCSNQPTREKEHILPECTAPVIPRPPGGFSENCAFLTESHALATRCGSQRNCITCPTQWQRCDLLCCYSMSHNHSYTYDS